MNLGLKLLVASCLGLFPDVQTPSTCPLPLVLLFALLLTEPLRPHVLSGKLKNSWRCWANFGIRLIIYCPKKVTVWFACFSKALLRESFPEPICEFLSTVAPNIKKRRRKVSKGHQSQIVGPEACGTVMRCWHERVDMEQRIKISRKCETRKTSVLRCFLFTDSSRLKFPRGSLFEYQ